MDADDISLPGRLARQVAYMEAHPEIGVLGSWTVMMDGRGKDRKHLRQPTTPNLVGWSLLFYNCVAHPSVVMRREVVEQLGFYRPEAIHVEDYDLWVRANLVTRIANIPETLVKYRVWGERVTSRHSQTQRQATIKIVHWTITGFLGTEIPLESIVALRQIVPGDFLHSLAEIEQVSALLQQLYQAYLKANHLSRGEAKEIDRDVAMKFGILAVSASRISPGKALSCCTER